MTAAPKATEMPGLREEEKTEVFIQAAIDSAPEPLRRLGRLLADKLDEDDFKTAERMLLALASTAPAPLSGRDGGLREPQWGKWFPHNEAPRGSYACLCRLNETGSVTLAWMPMQGRSNLPEAIVMPFLMPDDRAALATVPPETAEMEGDLTAAYMAGVEHGKEVERSRRIAVETELARFRSERAYVVGHNDGFAAAQRGMNIDRDLEGSGL